MIPLPVDAEDRENELAKEVIGNNVAASLLANVFYLVTRLCIPPVVLAYVSLSEYGLWSYCFIILSYLGMGVFGVTNVYVRYIAIYWNNKEYEKINKLLSTGVFSISLVCAVCFLVLLGAIPWLLDLFHVEASLRQEAFILIIGATLIFMADLTVGVFTYILHSLQQIVVEKIIWVISFSLESLCIILGLMLGYGVYALLLAFAVRTIISIALSAYVVKKRLPTLSIRLSLFNLEMGKLFLNFGGIVQLSGLLGIINRSMEKVLAGSFLGLRATGLYEVGEKFPVMSLNLPGSVVAALLPAASSFYAKGQDENIISVYLRGSRFVSLLTGSMMGFMAAFSVPIIDGWLGFDPAYEAAAGILTWFTIAYQMDTLTGPASAVYRAINAPEKELYYGFLQLFTVVLAAFLGFYVYGPSILTINVTVSCMMVFSAFIYLWRSNSFFCIRQYPFFKSVIFPGVVPYLMGFGLWLLAAPWFDGISRLATLGFCLICALIYSVGWGFLLYFAVLAPFEREYVKGKFLKIFWH